MKQAYWRQLVVLLALAFALRLAAGWAWQSQLDGRFGMGDSEGYWTLGWAIANGEPYEFGLEHARVFRAPGYPILLAPILRFAGDGQVAVLLARAEAALLGTLAVAGVWWLTRLLFDDRTALLAAALAAFYPGAIALSALLLSEAPFCPLMLLNLGLWVAAWQTEMRGRTIVLAIAAGLVAGAATLMRPDWLLFMPLATAMGMLTSSRSFRHLSIALWMMLGLVTVMLPWWGRNACVTGRFVPTTLQVGASLYDGLNPNATGASNMDFVPAFVERQHARMKEGKPAESFEIDLDRQLRSESLAWAEANPGQVIRLAGIKFLRMWNVWPNEPRLSGWPVRLLVLFTYTPLLLFAIMGTWRTFGRGWTYILCWLPAVYFTLLHMVFVSSIRYREPAMLALLAMAAGGIRIGIGDWGLGIRNKANRSALIPHP